LNQIKLSGILGEVHCQTSPDGVPLATAKLAFSRHNSIVLVAVDSRTRQLTAFRKGSHIRCIGRITPHKDSFVIMVDECGIWLAAKTQEKFAYDEGKADRTIREVGQDFPMG
jgi:hypothetical protein